ncbi:MAG: histidinol phosphate phosphatase domain-containing protein [Chloroflexi bacterium]|nr:histidinol phosphate phosphatase domain-containing protein [Chloroflexota bacterium]
MVYDFQTQSFLSDGVLSPIELIRRAHYNGYEAIAITDHVGMGGFGPLLERLSEDCRIARDEWGIVAIPGVELTHLPPNRIAEAAARARDAGAVLVLVHGETPVEPVLRGTNHASASCSDVDVLGHPGLITDEDAALAAENDVYLELSTRRGHSLANGHVALAAQRTGAKLLVNSDAHVPDDLLTQELALTTALGAGLSREGAAIATDDNPRALLEILTNRLEQAPR